MDKAKIDRINYLARQSRERELTTEEKEEQLELTTNTELPSNEVLCPSLTGCMLWTIKENSRS